MAEATTSGEPWMGELADGSRVVVRYAHAAGMLFDLQRDDETAAKYLRGEEPMRRWWRDHGNGRSGPYAWAQVLDDAVAVYRLELIAEAPHG